MGEAKTSYFLKVSNQVVITFCAAGVALCDIPTCFITCPKSIFWCDRRNTLASLSEDELHFWQQAQHFGDLHRHFAWQAAETCRGVALRVCFFLRIALSGLRQVVTMCKSRGKRGASRECHFAWQGPYFGHSTLFTLHTLCAPHFTVDTLHSTPYLHSTLYTSRFYTPHSPLYTPHIRVRIWGKGSRPASYPHSTLKSVSIL